MPARALTAGLPAGPLVAGFGPSLALCQAICYPKLPISWAGRFPFLLGFYENHSRPTTHPLQPLFMPKTDFMPA